MPELLNKSDVMRIINSENAVVLCCTQLRSADEVLCSIASQINSLQTIQISLSGKWREISSHKDENGRTTRDYECSTCLGILRDVPDSDTEDLIRYCCMCGSRNERSINNAGSKTD